MIKFGISKDYVSNWGVVQAIREIYQNFIDYGEFEVTIDKMTDQSSCVRIRNQFNPESWEFLKIGFSKKDEGAIGKHGEGLKLAGLIFLRNGRQFRISTSIGEARARMYDDDNLGESYGLSLVDIKTDYFEVYFEADNKDIEVFKEGYIKDEDIKHSCYYGDIVDKPQGNIYVGRLFVCNVPDLKYAINFKPEFMDLGRDREVPSSWDIEYYTNQIIQNCQADLSFKASDVNNKEFNQGTIPSKLAEKFSPQMLETGDIALVSGKTVITNKSKVDQLSKNKTVAQRIEKLRYSVIFRSSKTPHSVLKDLVKSLGLNQSQQIKFNSVIKQSKNWKNK